MHSLEYTTMKPGEAREVSGLIAGVFNEFVAMHYAKEGVDEFLKSIEPDLTRYRKLEGTHILVAKARGKIVGMISVLDTRHVSLFFVAREFQGQGVGRELLRRALEICRSERDFPFEMTVSSSPNALEIYKRLGFSVAGEEKRLKGIRFVPMRMGVGG